jgi:hypothetical protein
LVILAALGAGDFLAANSFPRAPGFEGLGAGREPAFLAVRVAEAAFRAFCFGDDFPFFLAGPFLARDGATEIPPLSH